MAKLFLISGNYIHALRSLFVVKKFCMKSSIHKELNDLFWHSHHPHRILFFWLRKCRMVVIQEEIRVYKKSCKFSPRGNKCVFGINMVFRKIPKPRLAENMESDSSKRGKWENIFLSIIRAIIILYQISGEKVFKKRLKYYCSLILHEWLRKWAVFLPNCFQVLAATDNRT